MKKFWQRQPYVLIQKAVEEPLSADEQARLAHYQETAEGETITAVHHHLTQEHPAHLPDFVMDKQQLKTISAKIDAQVQRQRRKRKVITTTRNFAVATAVLLLLFFGLNTLISSQYVPEPVSAPVAKPTVVPTPTLRPHMKYVDLLSLPVTSLETLPPDLYRQTILESQAQVAFDLHLPTQLNEPYNYLGSMVNPENGSVEIAIAGYPKVKGQIPLWILSQRPLTAATQANQPLSTSYIPFADEADVNIVQQAQHETELDGYTAVYEAVEHYPTLTRWSLVNTLAWQANGRQYTLTFIGPAIIDAQTMVIVAEGLHLPPE